MELLQERYKSWTGAEMYINLHYFYFLTKENFRQASYQMAENMKHSEIESLDRQRMLGIR